jgi:hypothetical protein
LAALGFAAGFFFPVDSLRASTNRPRGRRGFLAAAVFAEGFRVLATAAFVAVVVAAAGFFVATAFFPAAFFAAGFFVAAALFAAGFFFPAAFFAAGFFAATPFFAAGFALLTVVRVFAVAVLPAAAFAFLLATAIGCTAGSTRKLSYISARSEMSNRNGIFERSSVEDNDGWYAFYELRSCHVLATVTTRKRGTATVADGQRLGLHPIV